MPEKILVVGQENAGVVKGGTYAVFRYFCQMLAQNGYRVLAASYSISDEVPQWCEGQDNLAYLNLRTRYKAHDHFRTAIRRTLEEEQPALMVFFFPHLYVRAHLSRKFNHIPRILMFHSRPDFYFANFPALGRRLKRRYVNTHAQVLMNSFVRLLPPFIRQEAVSVIPNPVAVPDLEVQHSPVRHKAVYFSRLDPCKGLELLIEAFGIIAAQYPEWSVDVYGDSDVPGYREHIQQLIERKGLAGVVFLKGLAQRSTAETLCDYDLCVFPSRFEGFGIGLAEAMAVGLPSVGLYNCSGVNELIVNGENGLLCEDTPEGLAGAVIRLIENPDLREKLGTQARKSMARYAPADVSEKWLGLIRGMLAPEDPCPLLPVRELIRLYSNFARK